MQETIWALVPAVIAIALALLTKEVYVSLFIGIISGALFLPVSTCWTHLKPPSPL